ncbi:MAG: MgtC/SapB family protein [Bacteroidetes bacterium]|nr:MgtC/SapB family protein [Bacteroidota bacterium]
MDYSDLTTLGISFGLGLLVGLQRQKVHNKMAGVRTFTLIAILGTMSGFLAEAFNSFFIIPLIAIGLTALLVTANVIKFRKDSDSDLGQTTEVAALLMFAIGAYLVVGSKLTATVVGASLAILLYAKEHLHHFIDNLKDKDWSAIMTFVAISLVILPILPDKTYDPLEVINPRNIWYMVTLIVGISVVGYFVYKYTGKNVGIFANGILGGLISSTATTVSYARRTKSTRAIYKMAAFIITIASAISLLRVLIEVSVVIPDRLPSIILPILAQLVFMSLVCISLFYLINKDDSDEPLPEPENPAQLKSALLFGALYGVILLIVAFTKKEFGNNALYGVSIISGLTDVDAITLSLSQLIKKETLDVSTGWRLILLASLSNLMFKGILVMVLGTRELSKWIAISFGLSIAFGTAIIVFWPNHWHF